MKKSDDNKHGIYAKSLIMPIYAVVASLASIILIVLFAFLMSKEVLPESTLSIMPAISLLLSSFFSAYMSSKKLGRALLTSLIQAILNLAACYLMGTIVFMRVIPDAVNPYCIIACVAGAVLGGIFAAVSNPRRHKIK